MFKLDTPKPHVVTDSKLIFSGAVMFGSRALGVESHKSDYDFIMLKKAYDNIFPANNHVQLPLERYFKVVPNTKKAFLVLNVPINDINIADILVVDDTAHLTTVRDSINYMKKTYRKDVLEDKKLRIGLYEKELIHRGFTDTSTQF